MAGIALWRRMGSLPTMMGLALACSIGSAAAGETSASFTVAIETKPRCISAARSAGTNALVQVMCNAGQFVGIEAAPGKPYLGTQGLALRYVLDESGFVPSDLLLKGDLNGTITSLRVYNATAEQGPLELLVSF